MNDKHENENQVLVKNLTLDDMYTDYYENYKVTELLTIIKFSNPLNSYIDSHNCRYDEWLSCITSALNRKIMEAIDEKLEVYNEARQMKSFWRRSI